MLIKLQLPCYPSATWHCSTVYKGRQIIADFDSTDYASPAATFNIGDIDDRVTIHYHLDPYPRNENNFDVYLMTTSSSSDLDLARSTATQWSGSYNSPIRRHSLIPTAWSPPNLGLQLDIDPLDVNEIHSSTEVLVLDLLPTT